MVSAQVRAGAAPATAWRHSLDVLGVASPGPSADPLAWWEHAGGTSPAARSAGAAWRLAERTGAPLADAFDGVATTLREQQALADDIAAALAGPRATVRLLTVLPLGGVLLGELIGARPLHVLLGTGVGRWCAVLGAALLLLGRWWMTRMVRAVAEAA
jgi:tight adherence protein B